MIIIDLGNTLSDGELHKGRDEGGGDGGSDRGRPGLCRHEGQRWQQDQKSDGIRHE